MRLLTAMEVESSFLENLRTKYVRRAPDTNDYSVRDLEACRNVSSLWTHFVKKTPGTRVDSSRELDAVSPTWEVPVTVSNKWDGIYYIRKM